MSRYNKIWASDFLATLSCIVLIMLAARDDLGASLQGIPKKCKSIPYWEASSESGPPNGAELEARSGSYPACMKLNWQLYLHFFPLTLTHKPTQPPYLLPRTDIYTHSYDMGEELMIFLLVYFIFNHTIPMKTGTPGFTEIRKTVIVDEFKLCVKYFSRFTKPRELKVGQSDCIKWLSALWENI